MTIADRWDALVRGMLAADGEPMDIFQAAAETIMMRMRRKGHSPEAAEAQIKILSELYFSRLLSVFQFSQHT